MTIPSNTFVIAFGLMLLAGCRSNTIHAPEDVYGGRCGETGLEPTGRRALNKMLAEGDTARVRSLLRSRRPVDQAYGVEGMLRFQLAGAMLNSHDSSRIATLRRSSAVVHTCKGCLGYDRSLSECLQELEEQIRY